MTIQPLHDFVLIQRDNPETTTQSGIVIPATAQDKMNRGTVLAVGPGRPLENGTRFKPSLEKGQRVIFRKLDDPSREFEHEGAKGLVLMREVEVMGVMPIHGTS
jgi:chaperonin GroES